MQAEVMERKLFTIPSFKIYGGIAGLIDFGPAGSRREAEHHAALAQSLHPGGGHARGVALPS